MSGKGEGVEKSLESAARNTLDNVISQHKNLFSDPDITLDVLYMGNVGRKQAEELFVSAKAIVETARSTCNASNLPNAPQKSPWIPGPLERRLPPGEDIELHFESRNAKEESGAVIVTFQSQVEGFRGRNLSSEEALKQSAAIRLLSRIVKE